MRVGLLGGSFDPPHRAHVAMARVALGWGLESVVLLPAAIPPHKQARAMASPFDRYAMAALAVIQEDRIGVSDRELVRGGVSYTVDTLRAWRDDHPDDEVFVLLGEDNWRTMHTWKDLTDFPSLARCMVFGRAGVEIEGPIPPALIAQAVRFPEFGLPISATAIRSSIAAGEESWAELVPPLVAGYIRRQGLYGVNGLDEDGG